MIEARSLPLPVELFSEIQPVLNARWLVKGLLMASSSCVIFGVPGCGKSFLALDIGLCIATEREWFDHRTRRGGVVYIAAEGQAGLRGRVEAWRRTNDAQEDCPFALIPTAVDLLNPEVDLAKLRTVLAYLADLWGGIALVTVDTLAATFGGGDENGPDMAAYVANVASLCAPYRAASTIVTHSPLDATAKRPRGHSSLWGAADTVLHVSGDRTAPARRVHVLKQKDADPGADILFGLKQILIGVDDDGDDVTSCVIERRDLDAAGESGPRRLSPKEKIMMTTLYRVLSERGFDPPVDIPASLLRRELAPRVALVSEWRTAAQSALATPDTKPDTARRTFDRTREKLQGAELIAVYEDWVWVC